MGPYCNYCHSRCFVPFPEHTPAHILNAYGSVEIIATCREGQAFEKATHGTCYDDILTAIAARPLPEQYVKISRSCSWCHEMNLRTNRYCHHCGHRADRARMDCDCPQCWPKDA